MCDARCGMCDVRCFGLSESAMVVGAILFPGESRPNCSINYYSCWPDSPLRSKTLVVHAASWAARLSGTSMSGPKLASDVKALRNVSLASHNAHRTSHNAFSASLSPTNSFTKFSQSKIFIERHIKAELVIPASILIVRPGKPHLKFLKHQCGAE